MSSLELLKASGTLVVADTGDFEVILPCSLYLRKREIEYEYEHEYEYEYGYEYEFENE